MGVASWYAVRTPHSSRFAVAPSDALASRAVGAAATKSAARQRNARRQPRVGGKFAGPPKPAEQDLGPPPPEPAKPPRSGRVTYPRPGEVEPVEAVDAVDAVEPDAEPETPPEQPKPRKRTAAKRTASRSRRRTAAPPPVDDPPPAPPRRGLLAELTDGITAAFGGRR